MNVYVETHGKLTYPFCRHCIKLFCPISRGTCVSICEKNGESQPLFPV